MGSPPYWSLTGSQSLRHRKLRPYSRMAGAAPTISETMMPASRSKVRMAAECASTENSASAQRPARRARGGRPTGSARSAFSYRAAGSVAAITLRKSLERLHLARSVLDLAPLLAHEILDRIRQRHVLQIGGHLVAVGIGPVEELQGRG